MRKDELKSRDRVNSIFRDRVYAKGINSLYEEKR